MISCNKGKIQIYGDMAEVWADWATITTVLYKDTVIQGATKEDVNEMFTRQLFNAVGVANKLIDEEGQDDNS